MLIVTLFFTDDLNSIVFIKAANSEKKKKKYALYSDKEWYLHNIFRYIWCKTRATILNEMQVCQVC